MATVWYTALLTSWITEGIGLGATWNDLNFTWNSIEAFWNDTQGDSSDWYSNSNTAFATANEPSWETGNNTAWQS